MNLGRQSTKVLGVVHVSLKFPKMGSQPRLKPLSTKRLRDGVRDAMAAPSLDFSPPRRNSAADDTLELVRLIYAAVDDAARWPRFLEGLIRAMGARRASFVLRDSRGDEWGAVGWFGWPDEDVQVYMKQYVSNDPWNTYASKLHEGAVLRDFEYCPREFMEASAAFQEFYRPRDCVHGIGGIVLLTETGRSAIALVRGVADGPFQEDEQAILRALMPHLKLAAQGLVSEVIMQATTTTALTSSINPSNTGQSVTFTASVTSAYTTPSGTVSFTMGSTALGTATLVGGKAKLAVTTLPAGSDTITATYVPATPPNFVGSSGSILQTVN